MSDEEGEDGVREEAFREDDPEEVPESEEEGEDLLEGDDALPMG
jgi:hypothetical protein